METWPILNSPVQPVRKTCRLLYLKMRKWSSLAWGEVCLRSRGSTFEMFDVGWTWNQKLDIRTVQDGFHTMWVLPKKWRGAWGNFAGPLFSNYISLCFRLSIFGPPDNDSFMVLSNTFPPEKSGSPGKYLGFTPGGAYWRISETIVEGGQPPRCQEFCFDANHRFTLSLDSSPFGFYDEFPVVSRLCWNGYWFGCIQVTYLSQFIFDLVALSECGGLEHVLFFHILGIVTPTD